jgi:hypothetical protein
MDAECEAAKMLMQHVLRDVRLLRAKLPPECAFAALHEIERIAHEEILTVVPLEKCSCMLCEFTET